MDLFSLPPLVIRTGRRHSARGPTVLPEIAGQACRMVAVGDVERFLQNGEGCLVRLCDARQEEKWKPFLPDGLISLFVEEFTSGDDARKHAEALAAWPLAVVHQSDELLMTTRGPLVVRPVCYADGGETPRPPGDVVALARDMLVFGMTLRNRDGLDDAGALSPPTIIRQDLYLKGQR